MYGRTPVSGWEGLLALVLALLPLHFPFPFLVFVLLCHEAVSILPIWDLLHGLCSVPNVVVLRARLQGKTSNLLLRSLVVVCLRIVPNVLRSGVGNGLATPLLLLPR